MTNNPIVAQGDERVDALARTWVNLADAQLDAKAITATDEFFAPRERMLNPEPAVFYPNLFDDNGKWMDGWETRRRRVVGNEHCVIRLGLPGTIHAVDIDTSHFTGNYPPAASLDACRSDTDPNEATQWREILHPIGLQGDRHNVMEIADDGVYSHLRLNIYPDGGVARLRVFGRPAVDLADRNGESDIELSALRHGGFIVAYSDAHYGNPVRILTEGRGVNMGDGWETRRRREPGNEWIIVALARPGIIEGIEVDTAHFKGNYPDRCSVQAALFLSGTNESLVTQSMFWDTILPEQKLEMDHVHSFPVAGGADFGPVSHLRLNIHPDGGISRFRVFGRIA